MRSGTLKININESIKFRLNENGKNIYRETLKDIVKLGLSNEPEVDENGYTTMQIWEFLRVFGPYTGMHLDCYIVDNEIVYGE